MDRRPGFLALVAAAVVAGCAEPSVPPVSVAATPADRPLSADLGNPIAVRTAALIEAALAEVRPDDLRRCLEDVVPGSGSLSSPRGGWLIVTSALAADSRDFAVRRDAAPDLNPLPADGWQDRIVYRGLLRASDPADGTVACVSCVFDYEDGRIVYRHAYALDTCRRAVPPERDLAVAVPMG